MAETATAAAPEQGVNSRRLDAIYHQGDEYLHVTAAAEYVGLTKGGLAHYRNYYPPSETHLHPKLFGASRVRFKRRDLDAFRAWLTTPRTPPAPQPKGPAETETAATAEK
jgi:hypothetical protein